MRAGATRAAERAADLCQERPGNLDPASLSCFTWNDWGCACQASTRLFSDVINFLSSSLSLELDLGSFFRCLGPKWKKPVEKSSQCLSFCPSVRLSVHRSSFSRPFERERSMHLLQAPLANLSGHCTRELHVLLLAWTKWVWIRCVSWSEPKRNCNRWKLLRFEVCQFK